MITLLILLILPPFILTLLALLILLILLTLFTLCTLLCGEWQVTDRTLRHVGDHLRELESLNLGFNKSVTDQVTSTYHIFTANCARTHTHTHTAGRKPKQLMCVCYTRIHSHNLSPSITTSLAPLQGVRALVGLSALTDLDLTHTRLTDGGLDVVCASHPRLRRLVLSECRVRTHQGWWWW